MALTLEAQRNAPVAELAVVEAVAAGIKNPDQVRWYCNPQQKQVAELEAKKLIDSTTAALVLETRYPQELLKLIPLETISLAAAKCPTLPQGHIKVLGSSAAWACNCRAESGGLWCGVVLAFAPGDTELTDWQTGRVYRVRVPAGVAGGTAVVLEWAP